MSSITGRRVQGTSDRKLLIEQSHWVSCSRIRETFPPVMREALVKRLSRKVHQCSRALCQPVLPASGSGGSSDNEGVDDGDALTQGPYRRC